MMENVVKKEKNKNDFGNQTTVTPVRHKEL